MYGRNKAISWLVRPTNAVVAYGLKVRPSRFPLMATLPLWADLATTRRWEQLGCSPAPAVFGHSRAASSSVPTPIVWENSPLPMGQGMAVALSADGNTAIVGGWGVEGVWVFTRNGGGVWTQEGKKLVGEGAVGRAHRGMSLALSADGNTAIVGGWSDNGKTGAAWVFSRSGGVWAQQGKKLVGSGAVGSANQGWSVALSADGNTAIVGGPGDNPWDPSVPFGLGAAGAAWVFTKNGSGWTQEGEKLVSARSARQGTSVALSADGNIAIVGGFVEDGGGGAGLVFTRSGGHWTLDNKLVGTSAVGKSAPSVGLSADGSVAMIGGSNDNGGIGAVWVFAHSGGGWSEDKKLIGTGAMGKSIPSVGVSADASR